MTDSRPIVLIVLTIIGTGLALAALLIALVIDQNRRIDGLRDSLRGQNNDLRSDLTAQNNDLHSDLTRQLDDLRSDLTRQLDDVRTDVRDTRAQLRAVEIAFGKVDQRVLTLERVIIPPAERPE